MPIAHSTVQLQSSFPHRGLRYW